MLVTATTCVPAVRGGTVIASSPSVMVRSALGRSLLLPVGHREHGDHPVLHVVHAVGGGKVAGEDVGTGSERSRVAEMGAGPDGSGATRIGNQHRALWAVLLEEGCGLLEGCARFDLGEVEFVSERTEVGDVEIDQGPLDGRGHGDGVVGELDLDRPADRSGGSLPHAAASVAARTVTGMRARCFMAVPPSDELGVLHDAWNVVDGASAPGHRFVTMNM